MAPRLVEYKGWKEREDSGRLYRLWTVKQDVERCGAKRGDLIADMGPDDRECRFQLHRGDNCIKRFSLEDFEAVIRCPRWRPPTAGERAIEAALRGIAEVIDGLAATTQAAAAPAPPKKEEPKPPPKQNSLLRFVRDDTYRGGEAFTDWELLVDAPTIPVTRDSTVRPLHAIKGDTIREEADGDFELRRRGRHIGDPEWWQVKDLFAGLREDALHNLNAPVDEAPNLLLNPDPSIWAYVAKRAIPQLSIARGDVVVCNWYGRNGDFTARGSVQWLDLEGYELLRAAAGGSIDAFRAYFAAIGEVKRQLGAAGATELLFTLIRDRRRWGKRLKVWHSRLAVVRPWDRTVSHPIQATSDDAALFELLADVGGKMPKADA